MATLSLIGWSQFHTIVPWHHPQLAGDNTMIDNGNHDGADQRHPVEDTGRGKQRKDDKGEVELAYLTGEGGDSLF